MRASRVRGTRWPLWLGTCRRVLVVAGGLPLWCASGPRVGAPRLVRSDRSRCSGRLSCRSGAFPHPGGCRPRLYWVAARGTWRPAENRALCACRWPLPRQGRWARSASHPFGAPRWGRPWLVPPVSVLGCVRCGGFACVDPVTDPSGFRTVRLSTRTRPVHRGSFVWTPTPPLFGRRTPRPGSARVCVRAPLRLVRRASLPGAFWCASPFPVAVLSFFFVRPPLGQGCPRFWWFFFLAFFPFFFPLSSHPPLAPPRCLWLFVLPGPGCPGPWRSLFLLCSPPPRPSFFFLLCSPSYILHTRSPTPDHSSLGACGRGPLPTGCGYGGCGRSDLSPTPQRALLRDGFARCGGGTRAPGGGASCLGVGRPGTGALPPLTYRPFGPATGARFPLAVVAGCGRRALAVLETFSRAAVPRVLCALPGFAAPGGRCGLASVVVFWLWPAACFSGVPRGPALVRRASSGPIALGAPDGFPVAVVPFPTPGAVAPGFTGWLRGARGGRPRTGLFVPAAGPCQGKGAERAPCPTRSGPRDGVVPGESLLLRSWAACPAVVWRVWTRSLTRPVSRTVRLSTRTRPLHRGCFVSSCVGGRHARVPRVCVCVLHFAGSGGPASRARSGVPHLFLWPSCPSPLFGPHWARVARAFGGFFFLLFFPFSFPFLPTRP